MAEEVYKIYKKARGKKVPKGKMKAKEYPPKYKKGCRPRKPRKGVK